MLSRLYEVQHISQGPVITVEVRLVRVKEQSLGARSLFHELDLVAHGSHLGPTG